METTGWLTADVVEQIHHACLNGKEVSAFVGKLTKATLAGVVEYGCLRRSQPLIPPLPASITSSDIGRSLSKVVSEIGLTTSGPRLPVSNNHNPQEIEFVTVHGEAEATSEPMDMLYMRFTQATKAAGFTVQKANELQAAFNEMVENAVQHSNCPIPVLAGYYVLPSIAQFVVADVGRGILDSLRENPRYAATKMDADAIRLALHDGVSRCEQSGGFGFRPIFKAIAGDWGILRFRSKKGCWTMDGTQLDADQGTQHFPPELPGFQVTVSCRLNAAPSDIPSI